MNSSSSLIDIAPAELGLPPKFTTFREVQGQALDFILSSPKQFVGANAPTGIGKSLLGVAASVISGSKGVYLTATKALQDQINGDFACIGMKDMRGRSNYPCRVYTTKDGRNVSCDAGHKDDCYLRMTTECPRFAAYEIAKASSLIGTNYACWLNTRAAAKNAFELSEEQRVDLLICDEAHNAFSELASFLAIKIPRSEYAHYVNVPATGSSLMGHADSNIWRVFAHLRTKEITQQLNSLETTYGSVAEAKYQCPEYAVLEELKEKISKISHMDNNWVWEVSPEGVSFDVIWPAQYASMLWSKVPKILLLSATLWPYTMRLLGIHKGDSEWKEFQNGWPPNRGLVYYLPTARMSNKSTDEDYRVMVQAIDAIIDARSDRKGIVHTVSYARMRKLLELSRHRKIMHYNEAAAQSFRTAERFRSARPPAVLISPSYGTGWDFAYTQCEYQIVPKVPFPYAESRVMQERIKDVNYRYYVAMLELQQMIGRGRRAPDDRCETFILDTGFPLLSSKGRSYAPRGFHAHRISAIPSRPEKLSEKYPSRLV